MLEEWRDIPGYEGYYKISNLGNVKSFSKKHYEKMLKSSVNEKGYLKVILTKDGMRKPYRLHRLVASVFCIRPKNSNEVNHKDFNKKNNTASNLEWCTRSWNLKHAFKHGKMNVHKISGINNYLSKLDNEKVKEIRNSGKTVSELARKFKVSRKTISNARDRVTWKHVC